MWSKFKEVVVNAILDTSFVSTYLILEKFSSFLERIKTTPGHVFYHRHYVDIYNPSVDPEKILILFKNNPENFFNKKFFKLEKIKGQVGILNMGDEFLIKIKEPWVTPLRIMDITPNSFTMLTLDKNFEQGAIHFELLKKKNFWRFFVESLAHSHDGLALNQKNLPLAKLENSHLWIDCCEEFSKKCKKNDQEFIPSTVISEEVDDQTKEWHRSSF